MSRPRRIGPGIGTSRGLGLPGIRSYGPKRGLFTMKTGLLPAHDRVAANPASLMVDLVQPDT